MVHGRPQNQAGFTVPRLATCVPRFHLYTVSAKNDTEGRSSLQNSLDPLETCQTKTLGTQCWAREAWQSLAFFSNPGALTPKDRSRSIAPWWQLHSTVKDMSVGEMVRFKPFQTARLPQLRNHWLRILPFCPRSDNGHKRFTPGMDA